MAMHKYADATIKQAGVDLDKWEDIKSRSKQGRSKTATTEGLEAGDIDTSQYLLTHATIVASVDTEAPPGGVKTGDVKTARGDEIYRPYEDYYITPETSKFVNDNGDSWERELLLKTYDTFVRSDNYLEHVQVPELSKGKILDACARDLGETIYVDILVATNKEHEDLVAKIKSGEMDTLSMGCFLPEAPVTMADGTEKKIEDVRPGDRVYTHEGRTKEVTNIQRKHWDGKMVTVDAIGTYDTIDATSNHPFLVVRPNEQCACGCDEQVDYRFRKGAKKRLYGTFKAGHDKRIYNPNNNYSPEESKNRKQEVRDLKEPDVEWVDAIDLKENDWVVFPESQVTERPESIDMEDARIMGYYLAEGNLLKNDGDPFAFECSFSMEETDTLADELLGIARRKGMDASKYERDEKNISVVRVHDPEYASFLQETCGEYSDQKYIDRDDVLLWPSDLKKNLIGAYLNGDGSHNVVGDNNTVMSSTVSYRFHTQLRSLLQSMGIFCTEWVDHSSEGTEELREAGRNGSRGSDNRLPAFYTTINSNQKMKLDEYVRWDFQESPNTQHGRNIQDYVIVPIRDIDTYDYEGTVYNFEVEDDHSYIVSGYAVHNCQIDFSVCTKCGNVAYDEDNLCHHVLNQKGDAFLDEEGNERIIGELCGHREEPESNVFIEASWVSNPAFSGAIAQDLLNADQIDVDADASASPSTRDPGQHSALQDMFASVGNSGNQLEGVFKEANNTHHTRRTASHVKTVQGFGDDEEDDEGGDEDKSVFEELTEQVKEEIGEQVKDEITQEFEDDSDLHPPDDDSEDEADVDGPNESVIQSRIAENLTEQAASEVLDELAKISGRTEGKLAQNDRTFLAHYIHDRRVIGQRRADELYGALLKAGSPEDTNPVNYLARCVLAMERMPTDTEADFLLDRSNCLG